MTRQPHARRSGYTMLELLVVTLVLGVLAATVQLAAGQGTVTALDQTEILVRDACVRAQALARSSRTPHGVVFDLAGNRFAIVAEDGSIAKDLLTHADSIVRLGAPNRPRGVSLQAADFAAAGVAALFDAQGVPLTGGTLTIARDGVTRTLALDAATGALTAE